MKYILYLFLLILFSIFMYYVTDYPGRMKTYNHHMCVEVYGLDENCK